MANGSIVDSLSRRLVRGVAHGWRLGRYGAIPRLASYAGRLRSPRQLVSAWPEGDIPLGPEVAVFVHFDRAGAVREHVLAYVRALAEAGLSVVFVTNSGRLQPAAMAALQRHCAGVLVRRNIGYDFGAWREGLERLALPRPDTEMVVIANDSVYGPLAPLRTLIDRIDLTEADVWGLTESWQSRYHLQSYFLAFSRAAVESEAWRQFWSEVQPVPSKHWVIRTYEVGLTQALLRGGFRARALWPYEPLVREAVPLPQAAEKPEARDDDDDPIHGARRQHTHRIRTAAVARIPLNPTSDLWRQLLHAGYPFLKRELLRDNPSRVLDVADWRDVALAAFDADTGPIERDLQRTLRNRAP
ncbi:MAG TPA: rhamnan synthesis F family protein [Acetobacteraceae bacterium]|nr:rhamnan synthesis F family protein [Acetobacteraceae bacterium]